MKAGIKQFKDYCGNANVLILYHGIFDKYKPYLRSEEDGVSKRYL